MKQAVIVSATVVWFKYKGLQPEFSSYLVFGKVQDFSKRYCSLDVSLILCEF